MRILISRDTDQIFWIFNDGFQCAISADFAESRNPVYLNKETEGFLEGSKLVYKLEGWQLILYSKSCNICNIVRRVAVEP